MVPRFACSGVIVPSLCEVSFSLVPEMHPNRPKITHYARIGSSHIWFILKAPSKNSRLISISVSQGLNIKLVSLNCLRFGIVFPTFPTWRSLPIIYKVENNAQIVFFSKLDKLIQREEAGLVDQTKLGHEAHHG